MLLTKADFSALQAGGYASKCRQQLGIITFFRMFFVFFGGKNTGAFEYFNVLCAALIYLGGYGIVGCLSKRVQAQKIFLVLAFLVFPILFYTPFVYGELFSTALVLLGLWALLSALQKFTWKKGIAAALLIGYAIQIRQNALIVLIALTICLLIRAAFSKIPADPAAGREHRSFRSCTAGYYRCSVCALYPFRQQTDALCSLCGHGHNGQ
jgi:hypothetical protein